MRKEVRAVADKYCPGNEPLLDRLSRLPLEVWEQDFPVMEICLKDSIRLQTHGTGFRKNVSGRPMQLGTEVLPEDGFLVYHFGEHHRNPSKPHRPSTMHAVCVARSLLTIIL